MRRNDHHPSDHADSNPSIHFVTIKAGAKKRNMPEAVWGLFFCGYGICDLVGRVGAAVKGWTNGGVSPTRVARHRRREGRHQSDGAGLDECIAIDGGSGVAYTVW